MVFTCGEELSDNININNMALPDLNQQRMSQIYKGFLHTSNTPIINKDTLVTIYDGEGNPSAMKLGRENDTDAVEFSKSLIAEDFAIKNFVTGEFKNLIDYLYPVGAIFLSFDERNPQERFIDTEWTRVSEGRFLVGIGTNTDNNGLSAKYTSGDNSGVNKIKLTIDNLPSHSHDSLNFVIAEPLTISIPSSVNLSYDYYASEINKLFKSDNNSLINNYSFSSVLRYGQTTSVDGIYNASSGPNANQENHTMSFSGVSLIANTGDGIAFDNKLTSYGIYVWKRSK